MPIGQILGAVGSFFGQRAEHKQQSRNIRDQTAANKELAEYAYSKDLEQWERQNLYNAPTEQMARLREAGLNPKLLHGSGSSAAVGTSGEGPKYQTVRTDFSKRQAPLNALSMLGAFQDFKMKNAQIFNIEQEGKVKEAEAEFANPYYWARMRGTKSYFNKVQLENIFSQMDGKTPETYTSEGITRDLNKSMGFLKYQRQVQGMETANELKRLEAGWFEYLKGIGILKSIFGIIR